VKSVAKKEYRIQDTEDPSSQKLRRAGRGWRTGCLTAKAKGRREK